MEGFASSLASTLASLPELGRFVALALPVLAVVAAVAFLLRRTTPMRWLALVVDRGLTALVATLLLGMVFLSGLQIVLRNLLSSGLPWIDPLLRHLVLLLAFSGALLATGAKRHVQINVLGRLLHGVAGRVGGALVALLAAAISIALTHASLSLLVDELEFGEIAFLSIPSWMIVAVFPLSFLGMAFRFLFLAFQEVAGEAPAAPEAEGVDLVAEERA
ncbi:MAG: TRAP transporter small permease subunit [Gemmatimonadetes bacterium]|nr:TRAP transporter small permease subunit [Gemmatimonadota bacterium]